MRKAVRARFWLETGIALVTGLLFLVTLVRNDWIELLFKVDPDQGSGLLEWSILGTLLLVTIALFILAGSEWRRTRVAVS